MAGDDLTGRVGDLLGLMREHTTDTATAAADLVRGLVGYVDQTAQRLVQEIDGASDALATSVGGERLALDERVTALLAGADDLLARWGRRESDRAARWEARAAALHERVEAALAQASAQLSGQSEVLARRDAELERLRVDEFVRALQGLLGRPGARGLRGRVTKILGERPEVAEPEPQPVIEAAAPAATPDDPTESDAAADDDDTASVQRVPRKALAKKTATTKAPAKKTATTKAPAKKPPAKKAATSKRATPEAEQSTPPVRRTRSPRKTKEQP